MEVVGDPQPERAREALLDRRGRLLDPPALVDVLRDLLPGGVEQSEHPHAPVQLGAALQQQRKRLEAARDVLGRVGPVDAEDHRLGSRREQVALPLEHRRARGKRRELVRIDRDRMRRHERVADVEAQLAAHRPERLAPAIRVEADDVAAEQAPVDRPDDLVRQHRPGFRPDPRDVREVPDHCLGQPLPHEPRRQVQVVVVEEDRRARIAVQLLDDCVGEGAVDRGVPLFPGRPEVALGLVLELPQPVLDEPERRIGDDVVVEVVRRRGRARRASAGSASRPERSPRPALRPRPRDPRPRARSRST